jgi:hypothetical protein
MSAPAASAAPDSGAFLLLKSNMSQFVREEIQAQCAPDRAKKFKWPTEFLVSIGEYSVCFYDLDNKLLIEITAENHGFEATRAYMTLLCEGCPASGTAVEKAADGFDW